MLTKRAIPCLLLKNSALVKTTRFEDANYIGDPLNAIQIYNNLEVDELILLDITATNENRRPPFEVFSQVASECFMPFACGGGIKNIEDIKKIFNLGAEKVVICTQAVENPSLIKEASDLFGSQSIVVSIDVKKNRAGKYEVYIKSGAKSTGLNPVEFAVKMEQTGAGEIFLNSIDQDGMMTGYDTELIKMVSGVIKVPLIACGGAGRIEDLGMATKAGASAAAAGSLFVYQGPNRAVLINFPSHDELQSVFTRQEA